MPNSTGHGGAGADWRRLKKMIKPYTEDDMLSRIGYLLKRWIRVIRWFIV